MITQAPIKGRTLVQRLAVYFHKQNMPFEISLDQKRELGKILVGKLFLDGRKARINRVKIKEPEGEFDVIVYPEYFVKVIDATIYKYFQKKPVRIQRKRTKGWKMLENTVSVTRPSKWGNLYTVGNPVVKREYWKATEFPTAEEAVMQYRGLVEYQISIDKDYLKELKGKNLACFCKPDEPCHADVLLELANK